ncbi:MAG TPA: glycosyltransferase family 2 protein [Gemmataceae bacterium]|nr:glycosyltransferase family 2 protein [Gemmataceae bacterium]
MSVSPLPSESEPVLSIVVPLLNEEAVIEKTYNRLKAQLDQLGESYELVFVDDGSTDQSRAILAAKAMRDSAVRIVALSRNFGHEIATTAGLEYARGQAAVVMDADLQDPPEMIATFLAKWREGYQVVYGIRQERKGESLLKKATSFFFYRLMSRIADVPIPADTGDFRLMDRCVLDVYRQFQEDPRFFRGLIGWIGFRQVGIPFVRHGRAGGQTKYRYGRLVKLAFDTITAFSTLPALCITLLAVAAAGLSFVFIAGILALWICGVFALQGWMWAALGFLVLWNVQLLSLAMLGEYVVRTHRHSQRRPLFVVERVIEYAMPVSRSPSLQPAEAEVTLVCHPSALCKS